MFKEFYRRFQFSLIVLPLLLMTACQGMRETSITMWLQPNTPMLVNFPLTASTQIYSFTANPTASTQISLYPLTADLPYTAEIHDYRGSVIASVANGLRNAVLTVGPGDGLYEVAIKSDDHNQQGMLSLLVNGILDNGSTSPSAYVAPTGSEIVQDFQAAAFTPPTGQCSAQSSSASNVNIRSGPGLEYPVIASLIAGRSIAIVSRSANNWFQVDVQQQAGWISGTVITLNGVCDSFAIAPTVTPFPTAVPTLTPAQLTAFHLDVDRDGWGDFSEDVASTDSDPRDLISVNVHNLSNDPGDNYREFTLTLVCSGTGTESVRWGAPEKPTQSCGHSVIVPFTPTYSQQMIAVSLPVRTPQSAVHYTLLASRH
jgi:uncharacterized protein YraI